MEVTCFAMPIQENTFGLVRQLLWQLQIFYQRLLTFSSKGLKQETTLVLLQQPLSPTISMKSKLRNIENHQLISQTPNFLISLMITNIKPCATIIYISLKEVQLVARLQFLSHALKRKKMVGERNWLWL